MLLEFRMSNYKSFKDEMVFSMVPAPKQKGLDYSVLKETINKKRYKGLCSAIIYGPNASGKTNMIGAMDTFKSIVLRGNIRNYDDAINPNIAANALELIPNSFTADIEPVCFAIKLVTEGILIEYSFSAAIGEFSDVDYRRKIKKEYLAVNNEMIFSRDDEIEFGSFHAIQDLLVNSFTENAGAATALAKTNLNEEELFLMNGFKNMFSAKLVSIISKWLNDQFILVYRANAMNFKRKFDDPNKKLTHLDQAFGKAAKYFGVQTNTLGYYGEGDENEGKLCSILDRTNGKILIPAELFESYGTIRFLAIFPMVVKALLNGSTLVVDEFDASIHPMALMNIINIFHNDEINLHHAQLIFNTHNPIFLNANLYRRDEIKFVERDDTAHFSSLYSLSDFGTAGKSGVRKNENYMKNYFVDRYGAIKDIDFTPIFEELMHHGKEV
jgi:AAA15 family ATPase/GTPase